MAESSAMTPTSFSTEDQAWMRRALECAAGGEGFVEPNPMVGCVIVRDGVMLGEGFHQRFGGLHAEREALASAAEKDLNGATAYVTLEPCCHHGKTPPCTDALIGTGIRRVVCAMADPFAKVQGKGIDLLRAAGMQVDVGLLEKEARALNAPYLMRLNNGRPWIIGKWAMTLDGKIATHEGDSQWISNAESRAWTHRVRGRMDAIMVGSGTALADDPMLTARPVDATTAYPRKAIRVVVDSRLQINVNSKLVQTARDVPVLIWSAPTVDPRKVERLVDAGCIVELCDQISGEKRLQRLACYLTERHAATNILVEGGAGLLGGFFDARLMDECLVFVAPKLFGGSGAPAPIAGLGIGCVEEGPQLDVRRHCILGSDTVVEARIRWRL
ncbi:MAG: bifunctional diaminohydroxyphosphoribosylaminopyrimidine deaminase/5-amino-6-(5-phosphoribosylamino)uracil reductase RibD [Pirellulales bacterium]